MRLLTYSIFAAAAFLVFTLAGCRPAQQQQQVSTPEVPTHLPRTARPLSYAISVVPDAPNLRFTGSTNIEIQVLQQTDSITLNAADLEFQSATVTDSTNKSVEGQPSLDAANQSATFKFPSSLAPGHYRLAINYTGKINRQANGLFALDYDSPEGRKRALFTQFEAADARRFMPCWDEPSFRAAFDLRVPVPGGQTAIGNMPQSSRTEKPGGASEIA